MELHHFTAQILLPVIIADGLKYGDTPTSEFEGINAVNLTTDYRPHGQAWAKNSVLNKTEIRLTIEIADNDPLLSKWDDFAKKHVDSSFYENLNRAAGGRAASWYIYQGVIPWTWVRSVRNTETHKEMLNDKEALKFSEEMLRISREISRTGQEQLESLKKRRRK